MKHIILINDNGIGGGETEGELKEDGKSAKGRDPCSKSGREENVRVRLYGVSKGCVSELSLDK